MNEFIATLIPGQMCNVSLPGRPAVMRVVTKTETRRKNGCEWFYWYWTTGSDLTPRDNVTTRGFADCGYSGVAL